MNYAATVHFLHHADIDEIDVQVGEAHFQGSGHHFGPADGCESKGILDSGDLSELFAHRCHYLVSCTTAGVEIEFRNTGNCLLGAFHGGAIAYPCKLQAGTGQWSN